MKIFVTGATGFIGSHLTRQLIKRGYDVTAYARQSSSLKYLPGKTKVVFGDILDYEKLKSALLGFDAVYHNAALACDWADKNEFYKINVEGTTNVLNAIRANRINRLILTSSCAVLGEEDYPSAKKEESPYKPKQKYFLSGMFESDMNHYRITKAAAEKEAIEFCRQHGISLTVIRPVWVYGPREFHAGPFNFCSAVNKGLIVFPATAGKRFHVIYVEDLAKAMILALEKNFDGINIFNIGNKKSPMVKEYLGAFCKATGKEMPFLLPEYYFAPIGVAAEFIYKILGIKKSPLLTRARAKMFYCDNIYDITKAERLLGFTASTTLEKGIEKTVRWWRQNGFLS